MPLRGDRLEAEVASVDGVSKPQRFSQNDVDRLLWLSFQASSATLSPPAS
jgi:hypothetical protein